MKEPLCWLSGRLQSKEFGRIDHTKCVFTVLAYTSHKYFAYFLRVISCQRSSRDGAEVVFVKKDVDAVHIRKMAVGEMKVERVTRCYDDRHHRSEEDLYSLIKKLRREFKHFKEKSEYEEREQNRQISKLKREVELLEEKVNELQTDLVALRVEVARLRTEVESGLTQNVVMQAYFQSQLNHTVTVSTPDGNITGVVVVVGTDAVELRETNGDIVIIPYSKITAVQ